MRVGSSRRQLWPFAAVAVVFLAVAFGLACGGASDEGAKTVVIKFPTPTPTAVPSPEPSPSPTPTVTPTPQAVCGINPDPVPATALQVQEPQPNESVPNPFHLRGWGSDIAAKGVVVALIDITGEPLPEKDVAAESRSGRIAPPGLTVTDGTAPFATDILVEGLRAETRYCVWVFLDVTAKGEPKGVLQVPVTVKP
jgi:hypothetical protein